MDSIKSAEVFPSLYLHGKNSVKKEPSSGIGPKDSTSRWKVKSHAPLASPSHTMTDSCSAKKAMASSS